MNKKYKLTKKELEEQEDIVVDNDSLKWHGDTYGAKVERQNNYKDRVDE